MKAETKKNLPSIDKVTTTALDVALRAIGHKLDMDLIDKIIDLVELLEVKGDKTTLIDIAGLQNQWGQTDSFLMA